MPCGLGGWRAGAGLATPGTGLLKSSGKEQSVWPLLSLMSVAQWAGPRFLAWVLQMWTADLPGVSHLPHCVACHLVKEKERGVFRTWPREISASTLTCRRDP